MKFKTRIVLALGVTALMPLAPALAADYDPPIYVDQAPEYKPVEIGSGWYLRGDVGYNVSNPTYDFTFLGKDTRNTKFNGSIGVGYHFSDWVRGDINLGYMGGDRFDYDDGIDSGSASFNMWSGLVNGYVDLGTYAGFTPYLGAGVGVLRSRHKLDIASPTLGVFLDGSDTQYKFAYTLNAGMSYKVSNNVSVDVGYQYLSSPSTKYLNTDTLTIDKGVDMHQIKVGLRYDLW
jgi:opacity protein-like surface antigen